MRRFFLILGVVCIGILCIFLSLSPRTSNDNFDPASEGIVDVILHKHDSDEISYYALASAKRIRKAEAFAADEMERYTVPLGCIESYVDRDKNKVLNRLVQMELRDEHGKNVEISEDVRGIFSCLAKLEHDLMDIELFKIGGLYFVYVQLNVNLWTPCTLYYYDTDKIQLFQLHKWDSVDVVGLHVRDISLIQ